MTEPGDAFCALLQMLGNEIIGLAMGMHAYAYVELHLRNMLCLNERMCGSNHAAL